MKEIILKGIDEKIYYDECKSDRNGFSGKNSSSSVAGTARGNHEGRGGSRMRNVR